MPDESRIEEDLERRRRGSDGGHDEAIAGKRMTAETLNKIGRRSRVKRFGRDFAEEELNDKRGYV